MIIMIVIAYYVSPTSVRRYLELLALIVVWDCSPLKSCCLIYWKHKNVPKFVWRTHITSSEWEWRQWATSIIVMALAWSRNLSHQAKYENDCWISKIHWLLSWLTVYIWTPWIGEKLTFLPKMKMAPDTPQWCPGHFILWSRHRQCSLKSQTRTQYMCDTVFSEYYGPHVTVTDASCHRHYFQDKLLLLTSNVSLWIMGVLVKECIELPLHCAESIEYREIEAARFRPACLHL